jgi:5-methylcytosine-specific restriction endonuclease McrA
MRLAALAGSVQQLLDTDPTFLPVEELAAEAEELVALSHQLHAALLETVAAAERAGVHRRKKVRTMARYLTAYTRQAGSDMGRICNQAELCGRFPVILDALKQGTIGTSQVQRLAILASQPGLVEAFGRDLEFLLAAGSRESYVMFSAMCKAWAEYNDPTDPADLDEAHLSNRKLLWAQGVGGEVVAELHAPALCWEQVLEACGPVYECMLEDDWKVARGELGDDATFADLARTEKQRWFDALMSVVRAGAGLEDPGVAVEVGIVVDEGTLADQADKEQAGSEVKAPETGPFFAEDFERAAKRRCHTRHGLSITSSLALRCALSGHIRRIVIDAPDLNPSKKARLFRGPLREAILARDRWCMGPGCDVPAQRCEVDHIVPYSRGGPTSAQNGAPLCRACHRHKTQLEALGLS